MKASVVYRGAEPVVVDVLADLLADDPSGCSVGVGVPVGWSVSSVPHVQVSEDGSTVVPPAASVSTVRVTVRAAQTTVAQQLAQRALGALLGPGVGVSVSPLLGVRPARDPDTRDELAWFTVRVRLRSVAG